jgi:hypothetical protein
MAWQGKDMGVAWEWHGMCELSFIGHEKMKLFL